MHFKVNFKLKSQTNYIHAQFEIQLKHCQNTSTHTTNVVFIKNAKKYKHIFWTPCCVHSLNNAFKDIDKFQWITNLIQKGRKIIYSYATITTHKPSIVSLPRWNYSNLLIRVLLLTSFFLTAFVKSKELCVPQLLMMHGQLGDNLHQILQLR